MLQMHTLSCYSVQVSDEGNDLPLDLSLSQVLKILKFLFKQKILSLSHDNVTNLTIPSINLLTSIFLYCESIQLVHALVMGAVGVCMV